MRIFETIDKSGRKIYLTNEQWRHILKHPNMANSFEKIIDTLTNPTKIIISKEDPKIYFYFRYYKNLKKYLVIMIKYLKKI